MLKKKRTVWYGREYEHTYRALKGWKVYMEEELWKLDRSESRATTTTYHTNIQNIKNNQFICFLFFHLVRSFEPWVVNNINVIFCSIELPSALVPFFCCKRIRWNKSKLKKDEDNSRFFFIILSPRVMTLIRF